MATKQQIEWLSQLAKLLEAPAMVVKEVVDVLDAPFTAEKGQAKPEPSENSPAAPGQKDRKADAKKGTDAAKAESKNTFHSGGGHIISLPPDATGKLPLVVIFWGNNGKDPVINGTPPSYFKKALVAYGPRNGTFAAVTALLAPLLKEKGIEISTISICGYSSGGQAAFANYGSATKAVGFIDPNVQKRNFSTFDAKAIYSINPNPDAWQFTGDPDPAYTVAQARIDAVDIVKKAGGFAETTKVGHAAYPKYFLSTFESKLI